MINFNTNSVRFINNIRHCDYIPLVASVTNMVHMVFKLSELDYKTAHAEASLYKRYVQDVSFTRLAIRAIPILGQIYNAFEHLYYTFKAARSGYRPPLSVMTSELGHTYVFASLNQQKQESLGYRPEEFLSEKKLYTIVRGLLAKGDFKTLCNILTECSDRLITSNIRQLVQANTPYTDSTDPAHEDIEIINYRFLLLDAQANRQNLDPDVLV